MFDTQQTSYEAMLRVFWEGHDPTQGMRQGNDVGTQYRSGIYWTTEAQRDAALASRDMYQEELSRAGYGAITTEIVEAGPFYYAEDYHQQYLEANPNGYCGLGGTGVSCPVPATAASESPPGFQRGIVSSSASSWNLRLEDVARPVTISPRRRPGEATAGAVARLEREPVEDPAERHRHAPSVLVRLTTTKEEARRTSPVERVGGEALRATDRGR